MSAVREKARKTHQVRKEERMPHCCHFCGSAQSLSLTRLIVGSDERTVWVCRSHRG